MSGSLTSDPWQALRRFTDARIALGRSGNSLPTAPLLAFELAHARARDAVHAGFDADGLHQALHSAGFTTLDAHSLAPDREHYLRRPDLGRQLDATSTERLEDYARTASAASDLVFVVADGLSAGAAASHALPLIEATCAMLPGWSIGPVVVAQQARVALGDGIGQILGARLVAVLIGERPGLSSPNSLGVYLTFAPRLGRSDAERNCISNVRPQGLSYALAAHKLHYLLTQARSLGYSGVNLKDGSDSSAPPAIETGPAKRVL